MHFGNIFPGEVTRKYSSIPQESKRLINEIIEVTIFRDLMERHKIRNLKVIRLMFNYLIKGRAFSVHKFYKHLKSLNIKVSKNSLYNYLEYFNDAFIFFPLRRFFLVFKKYRTEHS